jgi:hypothetical protein
MLRKTYGRKKEELTADWKNCVMTGKELNTRVSWENLTEKDILEDQSANKMIILKLGWIHLAKYKNSKRLL